MAHIIVVDDDRTVRCASDVLRTAGHTGEWCVNGDDVFALLRHDRPDLLVLGPDSTGLSASQILRELRGSSAGFDVPVIALTGATDTGNDGKPALDARACVPKPIDPARLLREVERVIRSDADIRSAPAVERPAQPSYAAPDLSALAMRRAV